MSKNECKNCENEVKITKRSDSDKKELMNRINRIEGQVNGIKKMVENDRYCADILIQLASVDKSIKSLSALIFEKHMNSCVIEGIKNEDYTKIEEIVDLFRRF